MIKQRPLPRASRSAPEARPAKAAAHLPLFRQLEILDDHSEQAFERILTLAADLFDAPFCGILFHEGKRYWHKMRGGKLLSDEATRKHSFARHTMAGEDTFFVHDAAADPRFRDHPRVAGDPHFRFYIGAPLIAENGCRIGALAVMDSVPHDPPTALQRRLLRHLASDIMTHIQSRMHQYTGDLGRSVGQAIVTATAQTLITVGPDEKILFVEEGEEGVLTLAGDPVGTDLWALLPAPPQSRLRRELARIMVDRSMVDFEEFIPPFNRLMNFRVFPLEPAGVVICCREAGRASVAEFALRASEARLHRSERHLSRAQALAEVGSAEINLVTGDHYCSDEMYRIFGMAPGDPLVGLDGMVRTKVHPDDRERLADNHRRLLRGERAPRCEYRFFHPDGTIRTVLRFGEVAFDAEGRSARFLVAVQDVTELRAAERERDEYQQQLHHAQRLDALGTLAGGIAHDLNNTLLPVLALAKLMQATAATEDDRRNLEVIQLAAERARDLVRQVLTFSRKTPVRRHRINLAAVVSDSLQMLRASVDRRIRFEERLLPAACALADSGQIHQVVVNLVTNAVQAIGDRAGTVSITLDPVPGEPALIRLTVGDDGDGMDERIMSRMFEPFFTTRGLSAGAGLGLSIVHSIVTGHGGRVTAKSTPGSGTRITVDLPAQEQTATPELAVVAA